MLSVTCQVRRGDFLLDVDATFTAPISGLLGPSGSGKTTLLHALAGLIMPTKGRITLDEACLFDSDRTLCVPVHQRRMGVVFQDGLLLPHLSVDGNLRFGWQLLSASERRVSFDEVVSLLGLSALLKRKASTLSGGERQRVAIGRALLTSPRYLLLDEPLSALDSARKRELLPYFMDIYRAFGIPMLYVSHAERELAFLEAQCYRMHDGQLAPLEQVPRAWLDDL